MTQWARGHSRPPTVSPNCQVGQAWADRVLRKTQAIVLERCAHRPLVFPARQFWLATLVPAAYVNAGEIEFLTHVPGCADR